MDLDRKLFNGKLQSAVVYPEFFPLTPTDTVVNLACGVGPQLPRYKGNFKEMICVDILEDRLRQLDVFMKEQGITNYRPLCARVEETGLPAESCDAALCIDIIEHLDEPGKMLDEIHHLLKPGGKALVTIPMLHDRYVHAARFIGKLLGKKSRELPVGHPDRHNSDLSRAQWLAVFAASPLTLTAVRASTLFPPLHLYGVPRFWFTNTAIHAVDRFLCGIPGLRRLGQGWMCVLEKR